MRLPSLRVAEEGDFEAGELDETGAAAANDADREIGQIEQIQSMISDAEDDFQPAGTIRPEVELVFPDADHPFKEAFEHEEVITQSLSRSDGRRPVERGGADVRRNGDGTESFGRFIVR